MSKFAINDPVRVISPGTSFDRVGVVIHVAHSSRLPIWVRFTDGEGGFTEANLILAEVVEVGA